MASGSERKELSSEVSSTRRGKFYHETVTLEVEGVLHRVYRYGLEKWSHSLFRDLFSLPQGNGQREGDNDESPIKLVGCTNFELESLLEVMYPSLGMMGSPELTKEQWIAVLKLARLWDMPEVAILAINKLSACTLTSTEKIMLGKEHGVPIWLKEGYTTLIANLEEPSLEELGQLGWETACRVLWVRNKMMQVPRHQPAGWRVLAIYCYQCQGTPLDTPNGACKSCKRVEDRTICYRPHISPLEGPEVSEVKLESISDQVSQLFEEELKAAERRNTSEPSDLPDKM